MFSEKLNEDKDECQECLKDPGPAILQRPPSRLSGLAESNLRSHRHDVQRLERLS